MNDAREKAKALRYKKPIIQELCHKLMVNNLYEMMESCDDVRWIYESEDQLVDLLGDEDALEFKMAFSCLSYDCQRMADDLQNEWVPECFDLFFAGIAKQDSGFTFLGYDAYEGDYFGLNGMEGAAQEEARKKLMRMKKEELILASQQCFSIAMQYIGIQDRYEKLKASLDVLKGENQGMFEMIRKVDEAYEKAAEKQFHPYLEESIRYKSLLEQIDPYSSIWIQ